MQKEKLMRNFAMNIIQQLFFTIINIYLSISAFGDEKLFFREKKYEMYF